tara:strand:+ start:928 stop:1056 length:129 start_codon:yes stop_codon:yes gene_type:complete
MRLVDLDKMRQNAVADWRWLSGYIGQRGPCGSATPFSTTTST